MDRKKVDISVHKRPDLDACLSVYLYARHLKSLGMEGVNVHFVPAGSRGPGVNLDTGGGPYNHHCADVIDDCAASLVWRDLPEGEDKEVLVDLVALVKRQDLTGSIFPAQLHPFLKSNDFPRDLRTVGTLQALIVAMHYCKYSDMEIVAHFWLLFELFYQGGLSRRRASLDYCNHRQVITPRVTYLFGLTLENFYHYQGMAFSEGAEAIIYDLVCPDEIDGKTGYGFGLRLVNGSSYNLNALRYDPVFGGEDWYFHPKGFFACYGSDKNLIATPSNVKALDLAMRFEAICVNLAD